MSNCAKYGDYEAVLNDPDVDAVYISTPPGAHAHWTIRSASARKHVWCEKPAALTLESLRSMLAACQSADVAFMEGYVYRFHPQHSIVKAVIGQGLIGVPRYVTAQFTYPRPPSGDHRLDPALGGGVFADSAGYGVASAMHVFGAIPSFVNAHQVRESPAGVDTAGLITLQFDAERFAQIVTGMDLQFRSRYAVIGSAGSIDLARAFAVPAGVATRITIEVDREVQEQTLAGCDVFSLAIDEFVKAIALPSVRRDMRDFSTDLALVMDAAHRAADRSCAVAVEVP